MTTLLLSQLPPLALLAFVIHTHRAQDRERFEALVAEREWCAVERRKLLDRIQAPEAAQKQAEMEIATVDPANPPYVPWDDDKAFHEARGVEV